MVTYKGLEEDDCPMAPRVPAAARPADARAVAERVVRQVVGHLSNQQTYIPTKDDLEALQAEEASRRRFGDWPRPGRRAG